MESQKDAKINEIDALIESLSKSNDEGEAMKILKEQKSQDKFAGVYVVENMPAEYQPSWNALSEERQAEIIRTSKAYDFTKEGVLESFWQNVDFTVTKPAAQQVSESKDILDNHYSNVYNQMMRLRRA